LDGHILFFIILKKN